MARTTKDGGDPLLMGYVPAPPGAVDPLDAPAEKPKKHRSLLAADAPTNHPPADDVPVHDDESEEAAPFEDEVAAPQRPKTALSLPPEPAEPTPTPLRLEDPRELARRLAEEARQKAVAARPAPAPEPAPAAEPAPAPKKGLAGRAPPPGAPAPAPAPAPVAAPVVAAPVAAATPAPAPTAAAPAPKRSLAERAGRGPVSAQDALKAAAEAAAREEEAVKEKRKAAKEAAKAAQQAVKAAAAAQVAAERAVATVAAVSPAAPVTDLGTLLGKVLPGAAIEREVKVANAVVFRALWTAHRARAQATRDLALLATASVLLDAIDRVPASGLVAAQVTVGDRSVAVWADLARGVVLGFAEPPEIYLAGL